MTDAEPLINGNKDERTGDGAGLLHGEDGKGPTGKQSTHNDTSLRAEIKRLVVGST